jgi:hypothetical protein
MTGSENFDGTTQFQISTQQNSMPNDIEDTANKDTIAPNPPNNTST